MKNEFPRLSLDMRFSLKNGEPMSLTVSSDGDEAVAFGKVPQLASKKPADRESVLRSLQKLGGTFFKEGKIETDIDDGLFVSMSEINSLRREAIQKLCEIKENKRKIKINSVSLPSFSKSSFLKTPQKLRAEFHSLSQVPVELLYEFERVYLPVDDAIKAAEEKIIDKEKLAVVLPRVAFENESLLSEKLRKLYDLGIKTAKASNAGLCYLAKELGFDVCGGAYLNITNSLFIKGI